MAINQGRLNTIPLLSLTLFFIRAVSCDALFEAVHHPAKAPAMEIDVFIHAIAVKWLLLHKRPKWHSRGTAASALLHLGYADDGGDAVTIAYMLWYLPVIGIFA